MAKLWVSVDYAVEFRPGPGLRTRHGAIREDFPVDIPEASDAEAPVVLRFAVEDMFRRTTPFTYRAYDGRLWEPVGETRGGSGMGVAEFTDYAVALRACTPFRENDADRPYRADHPGSIVSDQRHTVQARLARGLADTMILDGIVCRAYPEPLLSVAPDTARDRVAVTASLGGQSREAGREWAGFRMDQIELAMEFAATLAGDTLAVADLVRGIEVEPACPLQWDTDAELAKWIAALGQGALERDGVRHLSDATLGHILDLRRYANTMQSYLPGGLDEARRLGIALVDSLADNVEKSAPVLDHVRKHAAIPLAMADFLASAPLAEDDKEVLGAVRF